VDNSILVSLKVVRWIVIYLVDSTIQRLGPVMINIGKQGAFTGKLCSSHLRKPFGTISQLECVKTADFLVIASQTKRLDYQIYRKLPPISPAWAYTSLQGVL